MSLIPLIAIQAIVAATDGGYPLAAALVIQNDVVLIDVPTKTAKPLGLKGLTPEEADLSPDKKWVAFNAQPTDGGYLRLYLQNLETGSREEITTPALGDNRFPRFADKGATLYFSAALKNEPGGPLNPGRVFRLELASRKLEEVPTTPGLCEFSPVGLTKDVVAHVSTPCAFAFDLQSTNRGTGKTETVASVSASRSELAASPDGKTLLYTSEAPRGLGLYRVSKGKKPELLTTMSATQPRLQPRFVCPKDVVFSNDGKVWMLDSRTGKIEELLVYPAVDGGR